MSINQSTDRIGSLFDNGLFGSADPNEKISSSKVPAIVGIAGLVTALASIPVFISSSKNRSKAATIGFNNQNILFPNYNSLVLKAQPAITLKIRI